jgi:hypothetical protein
MSCGAELCECHAEWDRRIRGKTPLFIAGVRGAGCSLKYSHELLGKQIGGGFDHVELEDTLEANALSREFCNLFYEPELANARRRLTRRGMDVDVFIASTPERSWECSEECPGCRSWNYETL